MLITKRVILGVCLMFTAWVDTENASSKYEYVDVDALLSNHRTLNSYINCVLDKGPCTPEGRDLKENIPRALKSACADCNRSQKHFIRKTALYVMKNRPRDWDEIAKKYNPQAEYREAFYRFLAEG